MSRHKKRKKLKKNAVVIRFTKASDFPNAPPLLALMEAGKLTRTVKAKQYKNVADGHD